MTAASISKLSHNLGNPTHLKLCLNQHKYPLYTHAHTHTPSKPHILERENRLGTLKEMC